MDCTFSPGNVCLFMLASASAKSLPGIRTQFLALHYFAGSGLMSCEFRAGVPWEDLYADDLVIIADSLEEFIRRLSLWKEAMEKKGMRVNASSSGQYPCAVYRTGVGSNSIYCNGCKLWVHKKCRVLLLQRLTPNSDYGCAR